MRTSRRIARGFTLIELMIVVAIIAIIAMLVGVGISRARPRATLASVTADVQALLHGARQSALASGHDVVVMVFPKRDGGGPRFIVYEDAAYNFLTGGGAVDFDGYDPAVLASAGGDSRVLEVLDLPAEITVGPATGMGGTLAAPLADIAVDKFCSFCETGGDQRGAVRFDARGAATFYSANAVKRPSGVGESFTLTTATLGQRNTFIILTSTGAVQVRQNG